VGQDGRDPGPLKGPQPNCAAFPPLCRRAGVRVGGRHRM